MKIYFCLLLLFVCSFLNAEEENGSKSGNDAPTESISADSALNAEGENEESQSDNNGAAAGGTSADPPAVPIVPIENTGDTTDASTGKTTEPDKSEPADSKKNSWNITFFFLFLFLILLNIALVAFVYILLNELKKTRTELTRELKSLKTNSGPAKTSPGTTHQGFTTISLAKTPSVPVASARSEGSPGPAKTSLGSTRQTGPENEQPVRSQSPHEAGPYFGLTNTSAVKTPSVPVISERSEVSPDIPPNKDDISTLYSSQKLRENRRNNYPEDIFLDINGESYQRKLQGGDQVKLCFEKKGIYMTAPYVLINNDSLYPNFHYFNEKRAMPKDNEPVIKEVFGITGNLPGFIKNCIPAKVSLKEGAYYYINTKGRLTLESNP